jgi:hypothetical protein
MIDFVRLINSITVEHIDELTAINNPGLGGGMMNFNCNWAMVSIGLR